MSSGKWLGVSLVKVASVYLVLALLLGLWMSIRKDFTLLPVHSHVALLGWAAMAITGLVYATLQRCAASRLAAAHFWLHNVGLPLAMGGLAAELLGAPGAEPVIGAGSLLVVAGLVLFMVNVLRNAHQPSAEGVEAVRPRS